MNNDAWVAVQAVSAMKEFMKNRISRNFAISFITLLGIQGLYAQEAASLSAKEILQKVRQAYASLSTYRDTGWTVHGSKADAWTNTFTELFGTRTYYRVEVITAAHPYSQTNRFWCDGLEHCAQWGGPNVQHDLELDDLSSVSGETSIPAVYFLLHWGNVFIPLKLGPENELLRRPDETVGDESCYVVARTTPKNPATLWIGTRDFLIRRCQTNGRTETHENISVNERLQARDYLPLLATSSR
jgi:hypothetical protein